MVLSKRMWRYNGQEERTMSRLDRHVAMVQNKLALGRFFQALAWSLLAFIALIWICIVVERMFHVHPPRPVIWIWGGLGAAVAAAMVYAAMRRPTRHDAAVAIDDRLA